jgi:hypothetical protein
MIHHYERCSDLMALDSHSHLFPPVVLGNHACGSQQAREHYQWHGCQPSLENKAVENKSVRQIQRAPLRQRLQNYELEPRTGARCLHNSHGLANTLNIGRNRSVEQVTGVTSSEVGQANLKAGGGERSIVVSRLDE